MSALHLVAGAHQPVHGNYSHFLPPFFSTSDMGSGDMHAFYRRNALPRTWVLNWGFRCAEFRHRADAEVFSPTVIVPADEAITKGAIRFRVSARNLAEPFERIVAIRIQVETGDTEAAVRALMPKPRTELKLKRGLQRYGSDRN